MPNILQKVRVVSYIYSSLLRPYTLAKFAKSCKKKAPNRWQPLLRKLHIKALMIYSEIAKDTHVAARQIWVQRMNEFLAVLPKHWHAECAAMFCVRKAAGKGIIGLMLPLHLQVANNRLIQLGKSYE